MADMKHWQVNHDDTAGIIANVDNLKEENKDLTNRSMRSTLIFRGVPESAKWFLGRCFKIPFWTFGQQIR